MSDIAKVGVVESITKLVVVCGFCTSGDATHEMQLAFIGRNSYEKRFVCTDCAIKILALNTGYVPKYEIRYK
jgi:transposase-like protein